jgi:hypothetical protein
MPLPAQANLIPAKGRATLVPIALRTKGGRYMYYTGCTGGLVKLSTPFGHSDVSRMSTPLNLSPEHCSTMLKMSCFEKYVLCKFMAYTGLKVYT